MPNLDMESKQGLVLSSIESALHAYGSREKDWAHDRSKTVGASEVGKCLRLVAHKKLVGEELHRPTDYGFVKRGDVIEDAWFAPALQAAGLDVSAVGQEQVTLIHPDGQLSGTPDGWIVHEGQRYVLECKSRPVIPERPLRAHHWQVVSNMGIARDLGQRADGAIIIYINPNQLSDIGLFFVSFDPDLYQLTKDRAGLIFDAQTWTDLPAEGRSFGDCSYCPARKDCWSYDADVFDVTQPDFSENALKALEGMVKDRVELARASKDADQARKEIDDAIRRTLQEHAVDKVDLPDCTVRIAKRKGRKTLDKDALIASGVDLAPFEKEGAPISFIEVK